MDNGSAKIAAKDIPAQTVYERRNGCFKDINPAAPVHLLLIPKSPFRFVVRRARTSAPLGKMMLKVPEIAKAAGLADGFKT